MGVRQVDTSKIDSILFDLGGVLLNIDYSLTEKAFANLGFPDFNSIYSQAQQDGLFDKFEKGQIGDDEFVRTIIRLSDGQISASSVEKAWTAMLLDFPMERVRLLEQLASKFGVFLLSNTNEIHFREFKKIFEGSYGFPFSRLFRKDYYSHQMGMRKPDAEVFERILNEQGLKAGQVLFVDDSVQHVEAASGIGIQSALLKKGDDIISLFRRLNILA